MIFGAFDMPGWKKYPPIFIERVMMNHVGKRNQHLFPAKFTHNPIIASINGDHTRWWPNSNPTAGPWPSQPFPWSPRSVALPGLHSAVPRAGASDAKVTTRRVAHRPRFLQQQRWSAVISGAVLFNKGERWERSLKWHFQQKHRKTWKSGAKDLFPYPWFMLVLH